MTKKLKIDNRRLIEHWKYTNTLIYTVDILGVKLAKTQCLPTILARVVIGCNIGRQFITFLNYIYNWKIWLHVNDGFKQLYHGCSYGPFTNNKGMYINLLKKYIIYAI